MENWLSPKYKMNLIKDLETAIWDEYKGYRDVKYYIQKWYKSDDYNWESFTIVLKANNEIDLLSTLHNIEDETLLQIAVDIGLETPDFIPSIATFKNTLKTHYSTANGTFEKAFKQIEDHPDVAIGLANSALESIIKEILKDNRISSKVKDSATLYELTQELLKTLEIFPSAQLPHEIKIIGSSMLAINQSIEKLRSEKTDFHGKTKKDAIIIDPMYAYFVINTVATVGIFLRSFYIKMYPTLSQNISGPLDDLPF